MSLENADNKWFFVNSNINFDVIIYKIIFSINFNVIIFINSSFVLIVMLLFIKNSSAICIVLSVKLQYDFAAIKT